jgi:predicted nuclease of predicted toxin-antitoxin system
MNILLDSCVWGGAKTELRANGHDVVWTGDLDVDPGDDEILAQAHREGRILVTLDKDFGELAIVHGKPHCGIIRLVNISAKNHAKTCQQVLALHGDELQSGAIITAHPGRLRIHPPPVDPTAEEKLP